MVGNKIYPLKFKPVLEETVWGGDILKNYRKIDDNKDYGIAWEVSAHPNATNEITNGCFKEMTLEEVVSSNPKEILGQLVDKSEVLRVSYINAKDNLSVQVHPHTKALEQNEIWYILDAPKDAQVILGTTAQNKEELRSAIENDKTEEVLKMIPVKNGDFIYIPGGLVHALTSGITVIEVGQNHDNTYRLFDYNRGRMIHVDESLEHTKYDVDHTLIRAQLSIDNIEINEIYSGHDFTIKMINGRGDYTSTSNENYYYVYTNLGNDCTLSYADKEIKVEKGESIMIPAKLGAYKFSGDLNLFKSYIEKEGK